jgi:hypothetical protein
MPVLHLMVLLGSLLLAGTIAASIEGAIYRWRRLRAAKKTQSHGFPVILPRDARTASSEPPRDERRASQ